MVTDICIPPDGAENGSVHWLIRPGDGALFSWLWEDEHWEYFGRIDGGSPAELFGRGWRYSHHASPTAQNEIEHLRITVEGQNVTLQDSSATLALLTKERDDAKEEVERLTKEAHIYDTPAWQANEQLNEKCEVAYQAFEKIIEIGAGSEFETIAREALKNMSEVGTVKSS